MPEAETPLGRTNPVPVPRTGASPEHRIANSTMRWCDFFALFASLRLCVFAVQVCPNPWASHLVERGDGSGGVLDDAEPAFTQGSRLDDDLTTVLRAFGDARIEIGHREVRHPRRRHVLVDTLSMADAGDGGVTTEYYE